MANNNNTDEFGEAIATPAASASTASGSDSGGIDTPPSSAKQPEDDSTAQSLDDIASGDSLGNILHKRWLNWQGIRLPIEQEWLKDLRAYVGEYEPEVLAEIGPNRTRLYVHLTRTKCQAAYSRLIDLYLQTKDEPWGIEPSPEPKVSPIIQGVIAKVLATEGIEVTDQTMKEAIHAYVEDASDKMTKIITTQLDDSMWERSFKLTIKEMVILGNGVLLGPLNKAKTITSWDQVGKDGQMPSGSDPIGKDEATPDSDSWVVTRQQEIVPVAEWVSCWDFYPEPYAEQLSKAIGMFERKVISRAQFNELAEMPGFRADAIADLINASPEGNFVPLWHEIERRQLAGFTITTVGNMRYEVLRYWGWVNGDELQASGVEVKDPSKQYQAQVWTCSGITIRAELNPLATGQIPYHMVPYEEVPGALYGFGVAREMRDSAIMVNAGTRALVDNAAITSGPQVEVNDNLVTEGTDGDKIWPWKVWHRSGHDPQYPLLRVYNPESNVAQMTEVIAMFRKYADEETSLPSYTHGEDMPGLNKTATGISMLMAAANVVLKSVVRNIDDYLIAPMIRAFYDWNMQYNEDETIKGDMQIEARGSTALIAKEMQSQRILQLLQLISGNPVGMAIADVAYLYRSLADSMELDSQKVFPPEKVKQYEAATQGGQPNGPPNGPQNGPPGAQGPTGPAVAPPAAAPGGPPISAAMPPATGPAAHDAAPPQGR